MKTTAIGVENLCVPCYAFCKYCLLSSCKKATGVDYERGKRFARRLRNELEEVRPDLRFFYYIGYCMDTLDLTDYIRFSQEIESPSGRFLQLNGLALRDEKETERLIQTVRDEGVERIDLTFYGVRDYHDHFAGRAGDFDFLLRILNAANRVGLRADVSFPLTRENVNQADELLDVLSAYQLNNVFIFLPHSKGRGRALNDQRLSKAEFDGMSDRVKSHFSKVRYQTEAQWLRENAWPQTEERTLTLCLTPDNIERLEAMTAEEIVAYLECLDDVYYSAVPSMAELAQMYGDGTSDRLFRIRDLYLKWQQMYLREHGTEIYDMNEESHHFSVHT